mgnify:CR=1 FL=1
MKILFLSEAVSLAHVGRPLTLAQEAFENRNEVHFACAEGALEKINSTSNSFTTHSLHTISAETFYSRVNQGKFFYTFNELKKYVEEEIALIKKINPALIVSDFRLTSAISANLTNKPLLNLSNAYWSPFYSCPFPAPNFGIFKLLSEKHSRFIFNLMRPIAFKTFGKELNQTREFYGLKKKTDFRELYTDGTYTGYMDMPDFVNLKKLPPHHFYLGPITWSPNISNEIFLPENKNYIYISMGSTGDQNSLPIILRSALQKGARIILSGVGTNEANHLYQEIPDLKANSVSSPLIKAENILDHCNLTICHGGSGTVYQSLSHGVPVMCLPKNPDQSLVSMALAEKNLGRYLSPKNATESNLQATLDDCLSNEILKKNANNYAQKIKQWNTLKHWNQFLNLFKTTRKTNKNIA